MDYGIVTCHDQSVLINNYQKIPSIFDDYQFKLPQFVTNDPALQTIIYEDQNCCTEESVNFFGMFWDRVNDKMGPNSIRLNPKADTKRRILSSLNSVFNQFLIGPNCPTNHCKLIKQYTVISKPLIKKWQLICRQANATPKIQLERFVGHRKVISTLLHFQMPHPPFMV